jgi:N-acetylmuramoyl-L-alanine amidase
MSEVHVVRQGECLSSIARAYGFSDWRRIYDDPANADFKRKRPNPDLIYPGDLLTIPDRKPATFVVTTGAVHKFKVNLPKARLRILLEVDEPYAYELAVGNRLFTGQTDGKSPIDEPVPANVAEGQLTIWPAAADRTAATVWELKPGHLDPVDELSGVQGRLANLGYYWGPVDGQPSADLDAAVRRFQNDENLDSANGLDDATRARLTKRHDGL